MRFSTISTVLSLLTLASAQQPATRTTTASTIKTLTVSGTSTASAIQNAPLAGADEGVWGDYGTTTTISLDALQTVVIVVGDVSYTAEPEQGISIEQVQAEVFVYVEYGDGADGDLTSSLVTSTSTVTVLTDVGFCTSTATLS